MLKITFPDGNQKKYKPGITGLDIASDISLSLICAFEVVVSRTNKNVKIIFFIIFPINCN